MTRWAANRAPGLVIFWSQKIMTRWAANRAPGLVIFWSQKITMPWDGGDGGKESTKRGRVVSGARKLCATNLHLS